MTGPRARQRVRRLAGAAALAAAALALGALAAPAQDAGGIAGALGQPLAQSLGQTAGGLGQNAVLLMVGLTVLSLAPGLTIMVTCFPFIVTVLSILRQSIGLQQSPPNMLIVSLAMFLTWYVMDPVLTQAWQDAGAPLQRGEITLGEAFGRSVPPFRTFMAARTDPETLASLLEVAPGRVAQRESDALPQGAGTGLAAGQPATGKEADPAAQAADASLSVLVPAFMLSEVQRAFAIGFMVSLPFLIIDLVVSAVLMSMGMMMVPPTVVALPFKLAFFVAVDGWGLIAAALVRGYQG